jgi:tRNA pseudouridine(38-40) synthase
MTRYKVILEYDGTDLIGWQENAQGPSVQSILSDAIFSFCGARPDITGAGRTDAGVHALGMVAHFDLENNADANTVMRALNFYLVNKPVSVLGCEIVPDDFIHEQCLVITQNDKRWLLSGCAHNGILNILDRYKELFDSYPDYVITGFHMMKREGEHTEEEKAVIIQTAQELSQLDTVFYSGHCTGIAAFELMKQIMGDKLIALHSGESVN